MWDPSGYGWGMGFGMIGMGLFWIVLIVAVVALLRGQWGGGWGGGPPAERPPRSALDILKERYARGEIGREEFEEKKRDLSD